jgi:predicted amidophosphoribosyltransferase
MSLILKIKTDRVDAATRTPLVHIVIERIAARLADEARAVFDGHPMLVPVPGSGLTRPHTV